MAPQNHLVIRHGPASGLSPHYPLSLPKMKNTWQRFLEHNQPLPDDWATRPEVLVGIKLPRPSAPTEDT